MGLGHEPGTQGGVGPDRRSADAPVDDWAEAGAIPENEREKEINRAETPRRRGEDRGRGTSADDWGRSAPVAP